MPAPAVPMPPLPSVSLRTAALTALLSTAVGAGCGRVPERDAHGAPPAAATDTVYLGVTAVSTGGLRDTAIMAGVVLAIEQLNAERPAGAPPLGVRVAAADQPGEVAAAAFLRDDPAVAAVVGPTGSGAALDDAPVFADLEHEGAHAVAALAPTATNPAVSRASPWLFRVCPSDDDAAAALARFVTDSLGARRVAVVFRNDLFGRGFTRRIAPELAARGATITERDPYLTGATRYEAYAARIARDGVDALLVAGNAADAAAVVRAVHAAGARPAVLGTDDVAAIAGSLAADPEMRGLRFVTFFSAWAPGARLEPGAAAFVAAYRARFGRTPDHRAALSYDAALLAGRAVHAEAGGMPRANQNVEGGSSRAAAPALADPYALRRRVRGRLAQVGRSAPAFRGVTGTLRFDADGGAVGRQVWIGRVGA